MKLITYQQCLLCICICLSVPCYAATYYFSANSGNDSWSFAQAQNPSTPWQTINKLNAIFSSLQPGDSILFKRGETFDGGMIISRPGTINSPIVLSAYGEGEKPVINGLQVITEWTNIGDGIFESEALPLGPSLNMVIINGINHAMGRYPNPDAVNKGYLTLESTGSGTITDNELPESPLWTGAELVLRNQRWILDRAPITNHVGQTLHYDNSNLDYGPSDGIGFFIQNDLKTLDQFGEWYYNPATQKLSVFFGEVPAVDQEVLVALVDILIDIEVNNILFEDLNFMGANKYGLFNDNGTFRNISIQNCDFSFFGIDAICSNRGNNLKIENCSITNSNNNAIYLSNGCINSTIRNNSITNTGVYAGMGQSGDGNYIAIYNRAGGFTAENNTILNTGYIGINFNGSSTLIKNNYIDTFCTVKDDGGGIYSYVGSINNTSNSQKLVGNIILNGIGAPEGTTDTNYLAAEGIYLDENVNNVDLLDNTIAHCGNFGIFIHNAREFTLTNNTFYNNRVQLSSIKDNEETVITGGTITDNIFFAKDVSKMTASFKSLGNDLSDIGAIDNNYYARPFDDFFTIETEINGNSSNYLMQKLDLSQWSDAYGHDHNSRKSPINIPKFEVDSMSNFNRYENGGFDTEIGTLICWSPIDNCNTSWSASNALDGGALEITTDGATRLMLEFGTVESNKQYLLRFSASAERTGRLEVFFREGSPTWNNLSSPEFVRIDPERTEYELLFSFPTASNSGHIEFYTEDENFTYWLDNVELYEARARIINPDDRIRFEYNPTQSSITIPIDTSYIDVKNTPYSGSITLAPFQSVILMEYDVITSVLPVELSRFYSEAQDCDHIAVHWTAEIEENFSHYELEKSLDGFNYETIYHTRSDDFPPPVHYKYLDTKAQKQNYYRLKMVDLDGTVNYSKIIIQQTNCPGAIPNWEIYPNPVSDSTAIVHIRFYAEERHINLKMVDQFGRQVNQLQTDTNIGWNTLTWQLSGLSPGIYYIYNANSLKSKALRLLVTK